MRGRSASSRPRPGSRETVSQIQQRNDLHRSRPFEDQHPYEEYRRSNRSDANTLGGDFPHDDQYQPCLQQEQSQPCIQQERKHSTQTSASDGSIATIRVTSRNPRANVRRGLRSWFAVGSWLRAKSVSDEECGKKLEDGQMVPSDHTPLMGGIPDVYGTIEDSTSKGQLPNTITLGGGVHTTWQTEAKVLWRCSGSLIVTSLLQYSLLVTSIFVVGHLGRVELAAVSLATMTANITGYAVYQGLATSLDTLAAQAYGSGRKKLVGLQLQRMTYFLWAITIPVVAIWACSPIILEALVPDRETAQLAGTYLRIAAVGAPGYAAFESGKRFLQAQGLFSATFYCLLVCAPLNVAMNYLFVWYLDWGFVGAPIAVSITQLLLPLCLVLYVYFIDGRECWGGLDRDAVRNWWPMMSLAIPGLIAYLSEFLAFEILTLAAARLGITALAAHSILTTVMIITFQLPFPISVGSSTRIAGLIGAMRPEAAKTAATVAMGAATMVGLFNTTLLASLASLIPRLFTQDEAVIALAAKTLPVCATLQLVDALASNLNGILRGLGRQKIGGHVALVAFNIVGLPVSFGTAFGLEWGLPGLFAGPVAALTVVAIVEVIFIQRISWQRACEDADMRNSQEGFSDE